jgi:hypothetical protein
MTPEEISYGNKWVTFIPIVLFVIGFYSKTGDLMVGGLYASYICLLSSLVFMIMKSGGDVYKQIAPTVSAMMILGLISVQAMYNDNISKIHVSASFMWFNLFIMLSFQYASFTEYVSPYVTAFSLIWFTSIVVMLVTQTTDGFTGINL